MLRLNRYILTLVLWLSFLFNIERFDLDIGAADAFNIASPIYVVCLAAVVIGLVLPNWTKVNIWIVQIIASLVFFAVKFVDPRVDWGDGYTYLTFFEYGAVLISTVLAYKVGQLSADFVETVRSLTFSDMDSRISDFTAAESIISREMQYSRRANRPLSVMVIEADVAGKRVDLQTTTQEIQRLIAKRHSLVALARLIARGVRRTDFVLDQTDEGRLVVLAPEMQKEQAVALFSRMSDTAQRRLGINLRYGTASFPEQGVTFEELLYQAGQSLNVVEPKRAKETPTGRQDAATEKLPTVDTAALMIETGLEQRSAP